MSSKSGPFSEPSENELRKWTIFGSRPGGLREALTIKKNSLVFGFVFFPMMECMFRVVLVGIIVSASRSPPGLGSDTASRSPPGRGHRFAQSAVSWKYVVFHSLCATLLHFCVNSGPFLTPFFVLWGHF